MGVDRIEIGRTSTIDLVLMARQVRLETARITLEAILTSQFVSSFFLFSSNNLPFERDDSVSVERATY